MPDDAIWAWGKNRKPRIISGRRCNLITLMRRHYRKCKKSLMKRAIFGRAKGFLQRYLGVAAHTPETLWIAAQAERALGNKELAKEYKSLLLEKFPLSNEAKKIAGG